jgi:hypothetical protein
MQDLINALFAARDAAHKLHLKSRSFAKHIALGELYEGLLDKIDELAEVWMGKHGVIDFGASSDNDFMQLSDTSQTDPVAFVRQLAAFVESVKSILPKEETHILNIWGEIISIVYRAKYKLENLQ